MFGKAIRRWESLFVCDAYISVADHVLVVKNHVARVAEAAQAGSHGALGVSDAWDQSRYVQLWLESCQDLSLLRQKVLTGLVVLGFLLALIRENQVR